MTRLVNILFVILILLLLFSFPAYCKEDLIIVNAGDTFKIELKSNPTTGYLWQLARPLDNNIINLVSSQYIPPETNLIGAGNKEVWIFKALKSGKTSIILKYIRPWENDRPVEQKVFIINIKRKKNI